MCPPLSKLGVKWTEIECNYEITIVCIEKTQFPFNFSLSFDGRRC